MLSPITVASSRAVYFATLSIDVSGSNSTFRQTLDTWSSQVKSEFITSPKFLTFQGKAMEVTPLCRLSVWSIGRQAGFTSIACDLLGLTMSLLRNYHSLMLLRSLLVLSMQVAYSDGIQLELHVFSISGCSGRFEFSVWYRWWIMRIASNPVQSPDGEWKHLRAMPINPYTQWARSLSR
jgi:hypothetical protein